MKKTDKKMDDQGVLNSPKTAFFGEGGGMDSLLPIKVHLIGIGGMGMMSLAGMFTDLGCQVQGSDKGQIYPPASDALEAMGAKIFQGYSQDNITEDIDLVIVGNVVSSDHPEYVQAQKLGLRFTSMAQCIRDHFILAGTPAKESIVVSGTHGKTTTSSIMSYLLQALQQKPSYFIGGIPRQLEKSYALQKGPYFVVEGDEYDTACFEKTPKFLHYAAKHVILTSLEFDHADIYDDLDHIKAQFDLLIDQVKHETVVYCADQAHLSALISKHSDLKAWSYGHKDEHDFQLLKHDYLSNGQCQFTYRINSEHVTSNANEVGREYQVQWPMLGKHNAMNALGCLAMLKHLNLDLDQANKALAHFTGVARRQDLLLSNEQACIYDDFAHHPSAVAETLKAFVPIKEKRGGHLWMVFEPRSNTARRNIFQDQWPTAFAVADHVVICPVYQKKDSLKAQDMLDLKQLQQDILALGKKVYIAQSYEDIVPYVCEQIESQDTLVFMSNGDFCGIREAIVEKLSSII